MIEANVGGNGDLARGGDGGVGVNEKESFREDGENKEASEDARSYFGRLHESPWSAQNWTTALPVAAPIAPSAKNPDPNEPEPAGQTSWYSRFFGE